MISMRRVIDGVDGGVYTKIAFHSGEQDMMEWEVMEDY
jgi:hypothetical protein